MLIEYDTRESGDTAGWSDTTPTVSPTKGRALDSRGERKRGVSKSRDYPSHSGRVPYSREWGHGRVLRHHSHSVSHKGKARWRAVESGGGDI